MTLDGVGVWPLCKAEDGLWCSCNLADYGSIHSTLAIMTLKVRKVQMDSLAVDEGCRQQRYMTVEVTSQVHQAEAAWNSPFNLLVRMVLRACSSLHNHPAHPIRENRRPMEGGDD